MTFLPKSAAARRRLVCALALVAFAVAPAANAQNGTAPKTEPQKSLARVIVERVASGDYWCVSPSPSDKTCSFILRPPTNRHASESRRSVSLVGFSLRRSPEGEVLKKVQFFDYVLEGDSVCLIGPEVQTKDIAFFHPATMRPQILPADRRVAPEIEAGYAEAVRVSWAKYDDTCWSHQLEEHESAYAGPEYTMLRYHDGELTSIVRWGVVLDAKTGAEYQLRLP